MKKVLAFVVAVMLACSAFAAQAFALDEAPSMGGYTQDAAGFSQCYSDYVEYYLFGVNETTRNLIKDQVFAGYEDGSIEMMSLMTAFANVRRAGQSAETAENQVNGVKPSVDVISKYYTLTDAQKAAFSTNLVPALSAVGLTATIADGKVTITKGTESFAEIKLVTEKPKSSTRIYLDAYIPGLPDDVKTAIEGLVSEYAAAGGGPAGSGAVWRCIREIGTLMGVEAKSNVDMTAGTMSIEVLKEGEKYFKNLSKETQDAVIAKVEEAMSGIGFTAEYANGTVTVKKDAEVRLTYVLIPAEETTTTKNTTTTTTTAPTATMTTTAPTATTEAPATIATTAANAESTTGTGSVSIPKTGEANTAYLFGLLTLAAAGVLFFAAKKKSFFVTDKAN